MLEVIKQWYNRYFSDPQAVLLVVLLTLGFTILLTMGTMLTPVLASVVLAYLLDGIVTNLQSRGIRHFPAVMLVFTLFFTLFIFILLILLPTLVRQITQLVQELPNMLANGQKLLMQLPDRYPHFISQEEVTAFTDTLREHARHFGQSVLSYSLATIPALIALIIYCIMVPLMIFFFLKDKQQILDWLLGFLPQERTVANLLWQEMDRQIGNYVRGKVNEIIIVAVLTYIPFALMGLNYSPLLAVLVGLSVIIPYIGAVVVTIPVVLVAFLQWGFTSDFLWVMTAYLIVQGFDGNVLVPLLFSGAVNLHPVAIIIAVLVFGGLWGFWGVFFAIPLAALVKALLSAWPRTPTNKLSFKDQPVADNS